MDKTNKARVTARTSGDLANRRDLAEVAISPLNSKIIPTCCAAGYKPFREKPLPAIRGAVVGAATGRVSRQLSSLLLFAVAGPACFGKSFLL